MLIKFLRNFGEPSLILGSFGGSLLNAGPSFTALYRAFATDWDGSSIVGDGITFTGTGPILTNGALVFDGVDDVLTSTESFDMNGKTFLLVSKQGVSNNSRDSVITFNTGIGALSIEAKTAGLSNGRLRSAAGVGLGSTLLSPVDNRNNLFDSTGQTAIHIVQIDNVGGTARVGLGEFYAEETTATNVSRGITSIRLGSDAGVNYQATDFYELIIIDSIDPADVFPAVEYMRSTYSALAPYFTVNYAKGIRIVGDSISAGVGATSPNGFAYVTTNNFVATREMSGFAGSQISTFGLDPLADAGAYTAAFVNVSADASLFTGSRATFGFWGTNDYGGSHGGVPIGVTGSTDVADFNGALNVGWTQFLANAPAENTLFLFTPIHRTVETANTAGHTLEAYRQAIRDKVARENNPRLVLVEMSGSGIVDADLPDGLHPNDTGHGKIAVEATRQIAAHYGIVR